jgi:hypothetical protein
VQPQAGAAFKLFGGRIVGRNVELIPNQNRAGLASCLVACRRLFHRQV